VCVCVCVCVCVFLCSIIVFGLDNKKRIVAPATKQVSLYLRPRMGRVDRGGGGGCVCVCVCVCVFLCSIIVFGLNDKKRIVAPATKQ
jgi:hypothetical protein